MVSIRRIDTSCCTLSAENICVLMHNASYTSMLSKTNNGE